jgi:hypothetical protein
MFSAWGDATLSITGTDDNPAFLAAMAYQDVYRYAPSGNTDYKPTPSIWLKRRGYRNSAQLNFAKSGYDFRGEGNNFNGYGGAAIFMDAGQGGCIFQCWDSSGNSLAGTHTPHPYGTDPRGAQNSRLENITFSSRGGTVGDTTQNGVLIHTQISMRGVHAFHFGGHGIAIVADVGNGTNANATSLEDCGGSYSGISGYFDSGGDVNAGRNIGFQAFNNNAFGIHAGNFLGQFYLYFQVDGNGYGGSCGPSWGGAANSAGSGATQAGNHYRVIPGQEVGARTNAPSGTTASNTWWSWIEAGAASTLYPAWVSGHKYMAGGAFFAGGGDYGVNNNARNVFAGYAEGNQLGGLSFSNTSCCLPGFAGWSGAYLNVSSGAMVSPKIGAIKPGSVAGYQLGALLGSSTADDIYMTLGNSNAGTMNWTFTADNTDVLSAQWLGAGGSQPYFLLPGTTTPGVQFYRGIKIFNSVHYSGTAPPTTGTWVLGTVMWNETPAAAGPPGWVCTTAGTPGTWKAMANLAA